LLVLKWMRGFLCDHWQPSGAAQECVWSEGTAAGGGFQPSVGGFLAGLAQAGAVISLGKFLDHLAIESWNVIEHKPSPKKYVL
jgi:hypothetical protein